MLGPAALQASNAAKAQQHTPGPALLPMSGESRTLAEQACLPTRPPPQAVQARRPTLGACRSCLCWHSKGSKRYAAHQNAPAGLLARETPSGKPGRWSAKTSVAPACVITRHASGRRQAPRPACSPF